MTDVVQLLVSQIVTEGVVGEEPSCVLRCATTVPAATRSALTPCLSEM